MLPQINSDLALRGIPTFYYGNFSDGQKRWESFGHEPRDSTEYMGLRGKMGILVESYSYASYRRRIDASYLFVDACLKQITGNAKSLQSMINVVPTAGPMSVPLQAKIVADEQPTIAKGYSWAKKITNPAKVGVAVVEEDNDHEQSAASETTKNSYPTPKDRKRKAEIVPTDFEVQLINLGASTLAVDAPDYYFVPAENAWAMGRLRMHGVQMSWVDAANAVGSSPISASQYRIDSKVDQPEFQYHSQRKVTVTSEPMSWNSKPGWIVPTKQPLGVLATYMMAAKFVSSVDFAMIASTTSGKEASNCSRSQRSALGNEIDDTSKIYKDLGSTEMRDLEDAVQWLKQQTWVDSDKIGIWGWSYGGYFTAYAMTHSNLFRAGIAGAPVTDWNNYDSVYTERFMDTPQANPEGYKSSSVVTAAKNLHGRLMLIHGEIDDNVHMANTMQLVHALQKANKKFDLMVYPNNRHGVVDPDQSFHQYQMMTDFFKQHLSGN